MQVEIVSFAEADVFRGFLTEEELRHSALKTNDAVRTRFVIARGLRRRMLDEATQIRAADLRFLEDGESKPRVLDAQGWDFNISHAGEYVACAVARGQVGVDIEQIRPVREMESIVERYFHPDEAAEWRALPPGLREEAFFVLWSAREAAMKCVGLGLARGMSVTRVDPSILRESCARALVGDAALVVRRWDAPPGCVAMIAQGAAI
jgi:4'-phosphopantetheinyl transferase